MNLQTNIYQTIKNILQTARDNAYKQVNFIMVEAYWNIGKQIVEEEQKGEDRAKYGSYLIKELSEQLSNEFGKGYSSRNLRNMRKFYLSFPKWQTVTAKLSWSHYAILLRVENKNARVWYMEESIKSSWSTRALERQIGTHYYERLLSSQEKKSVELEAVEKTKDMYVRMFDDLEKSEKEKNE